MDTLFQMNDEELDGLDLRFIRESVGVQPSPHRHYSLPRWIKASIVEILKYPRDMVDLASGNDPNKLVDFLRLQGQLQGEESDDDEEND